MEVADYDDDGTRHVTNHPCDGCPVQIVHDLSVYFDWHVTSAIALVQGKRFGVTYQAESIRLDVLFTAQVMDEMQAEAQKEEIEKARREAERGMKVDSNSRIHTTGSRSSNTGARKDSWDR